MNWSQLAGAGLTALALALGAGAQAGPHGVKVGIGTERHTLGKDDDVIVNVTITNTASTPQYVLKWHTPFGEIEESLFEVRRDGLPVTYLGTQYKRALPTARDYYLLKPGASHSASVELSSLYDMSVTGDYVIRYATGAMGLFSTELAKRGKAGIEREISELKSEPVSIWIDGRQPRGAPAQEAQAPGAPGLSFNKCSASQQGTVSAAVSAGLSMAGDGEAYIGAGGLGARYIKWFGALDAGRSATVQAHFVALKDAFANKPVAVDCGCKKPYYAYVYPSKPYAIYVCKAFWSAPMTGIDSKGGTLVHEMSHFTLVAGTDDWVYGQAGAASLALSDPAKAIDNADSHEYFGENAPPLP
jgi:peptidyl-Lys metalloendopeptidase